MTELAYALTAGKVYAEALVDRVNALKKENEELRTQNTLLQAKLTLATAAPLRDLPPLPSRSETTTPDELDTLAANVEACRKHAMGVR